MAMMVNREAPYSGVSNLMALKGRMGDTELVHMSKPEVRGLQSLGQLTVNPSTGLPEAFKLKSILPLAASIAFPALAPAGLTAALGTTGLAALGTGVGSLLAGKGLGESLLSAGLSFGLGSIMGGGADNFGNLSEKAAEGALKPAQQGMLNKAAGTFVDGGSAFSLDIQDAIDAAVNPQEIAGLQLQGLTEAGVTNPAALASRSFGEKAVGLFSPESALKSQLTRAGAIVPETFGEKLTQSAIQQGPTALGTFALETALTPPEPGAAPEKKPTTITPQEMYVAEEGAGAPTQQTALDTALRGGAERQLPIYGYRNLPSYTVAKTGGLIGLAEGGMPKVIEGGDIKYTPTTQSALKDALIGPSQQMIEPYRMRNKTLEEVSPDEQKALFYRKLQETDNPMLQLLGKLSQQFPDRFNSQSASPQQNGQIGSGFNVGANVGNTKGYAEGGVVEEQGEYFEGRVEGNGDGMSDEVEYEVEGENPDMAMLSRDEYVLPADVVAILGNGSSEAGADKLDMFIKQTRKEAFGTEKQQKEMKGDGGLTSLVA